MNTLFYMRKNIDWRRENMTVDPWFYFQVGWRAWLTRWMITWVEIRNQKILIVKVFILSVKENQNDNHLIFIWIFKSSISSKNHFLSNLYDTDKLSFSYTKPVKIVLGICLAMSYLEEAGVIKAYLYPGHILIDRDFNPLICDLSFASSNRFGYEIDVCMRNEDYLPIIDEVLSIKTAVYSLGIIIYRMFFN